MGKSVRKSEYKRYDFLFNKTVKKIISKQLSIKKNEMCKKYVKENNEPEIFDEIKYLQNQLNNTIESKKKSTTPIYQIGW